MATLLSAFNSSYSENASVLTGRPNRVDVEVEDDVDARFWSDLLSSLCPDKEFHFDPYQTLTPAHPCDRQGKGKCAILKDAPSFNAFRIGCVDSDYDWLLSDRTEAGKIISGNRYLLQTYGYSIESLLCLDSTLREYCMEVTGEEPDFDFCGYLARLSRIVYPLLVWSVYLYGQGKQDFTPQAWRGVLVNTLLDPESSLLEIERQVSEQLRSLEQAHSSEVEARDQWSGILEQKGVSSSNAYLYVRGHELFDHLLNSLLRPLVKGLCDVHFQRLNNVERSDYQKMLKRNTPEIVLYRNYRYKQRTELYDRIVQDVRLIWG